jgi:hypothetical protein
MFGRQVFYYISHLSSSFSFGYFSDRVLSFCPGPALGHSHPIYASCITVITEFGTVPVLFVEMVSH